MNSFIKYILGLGVMLVFFAEPALAQDLSGIESMLDTIVDAFTGPIGRGIAILGIVGLGVAWIMGYVNFATALWIFIGIVLIFSAAAIVDGFIAA